MGDKAELEKLRRLKELESRVTTSISGRQKNVDNMSMSEQFGTGVGNESEMIARKLGNLGDTVGRKVLRGFGVDVKDGPPADYSYSKETIARRQKEQDPVQNTVPGFLGGMTADMAATAPLGVVGKGMELAAGARGVPRAVGAVLRARPVQAASEGSLAGAELAAPGERGEGAKYGAGGGVIGERIGRVLGRAVRGFVKRSPEAEALDNLADAYETRVQLPLAAAASDKGYVSPFMKFIYGKVLPSLPGAEGALAKQGARANAQFREIVMKEASPGGMGSNQPGYSGGLPLTTKKAGGAGSDVRMTMRNIEDAFDKEYGDTIKQYSFNVPQAAGLEASIKAKFPGIDDATANGVVKNVEMLMSDLGDANGQINGTNVIRAKSALSKLGNNAKDDFTGQVFNHAQEYLDDIVRTELRVGNKPQNIKDLERYEQLAEPYANFLRLQKAAARAKNPDGEFTPQELSRVAKIMAPDRQVARGEAPMQELAGLGEKTVGQGNEPPTFLERAASISALSGLGFLGGGVAGPAAVWAAGRGAVSPVVQDALMGQLDSQKTLARLLREHPEKARAIGAMVRNSMAAKASEEETDEP